MFSGYYTEPLAAVTGGGFVGLAGWRSTEMTKNGGVWTLETATLMKED